MNSMMIGKIEKAHRYAHEPERIKLQDLTASFHGGHDDYDVALRGGSWTCSCHTFETQAIGTCSHIMALQEILRDMLTTDARFSVSSEEPVGVAG